VREEDRVGCPAGVEAGVYVPETISLIFCVNKELKWERQCGLYCSVTVGCREQLDFPHHPDSRRRIVRNMGTLLFVHWSSTA
jgi:hypothetical protein